MIEIKEGGLEDTGYSAMLRNAIVSMRPGTYFDLPLDGKSAQHRRTQVFHALADVADARIKLRTKCVGDCLRVARVEPVTYDPSEHGVSAEPAGEGFASFYDAEPKPVQNKEDGK